MSRSKAGPPAGIPDDVDVLALSASENADLCTGCTRCCETVSIEIDAPRSAWEYDQWVWVLHHRSLEVYVEKPERWFLHIETRCEQLNEQGRCRIHGSHPILCREYDPRVCERRLPLADIVAWFKTAAELEHWLRERRPAHWKRLEAWRARKTAAARRRNGAAALLQIAEPPTASHEPAIARRAHPTPRRRR